VVCINKLDMVLEAEGRDGAAARKAADVAAVGAVADALVAADRALSRPMAVVGISAKAKKGLTQLQAALDAALAESGPSVGGADAED
jgi:hypothetical protein